MFENVVEKIRALHAPSFYPLNLTRRSVTPELRAPRPPLRLKYTFYELYFMNLSKCLLTMVSLARPEQFLDEEREGWREEARASERERGNFQLLRALAASSAASSRTPERGVAFISRSELAILSDGNTRKKLTAGICRAP